MTPQNFGHHTAKDECSSAIAVVHERGTSQNIMLRQSENVFFDAINTPSGGFSSMTTKQFNAQRDHRRVDAAPAPIAR
jgi:hypothetical protein